MNAETATTTDLADILGQTRHLLLDFDGPVCSLFAGTPTAPVAGRLRDVVARHVISMPEEIDRTSDWFAILAFAASAGRPAGASTEAELTRVECRAAVTATPAPHLEDVLAACAETGRRVAVVSNNSAQAVGWYLSARGLDRAITVVAAREGNEPARLKPSPHVVEAAARRLGVPTAACAVVGDSAADMRAAQAAGAWGIGYAPAAGGGTLTRAGAAAVVTSLATLARGLRASRPGPAVPR